MARRSVLVRDRDTAIALGVGFYLLGSLFLWDAHERRGASRPFWLRWLPGA